MIIIGHLLDHAGFCHHTEAAPAPMRTGANFRVKHVYSHEPIELRAVADPCPLTDGHGGAVLGRVQHVEVGASGDAYAVCDLYAPLPGRAADEHGSVYLSAEGLTRNGQLELTAVALTATPAMMLRPIELIPSPSLEDLDEAAVLRLRRARPHTSAVLERSRTALRARGWREAVHVQDLREPDVQLIPGVGALVDGELVPASARRQPGQLWHRPGGAILGVR